ncbi:MAG: TIR domain-containing protein, partial [Acidobacteriota bacterium]
MNKPTVFISYSHRDKRWLRELQTHLKPFVHNEKIALWDDTRIKAGTRWQKEIAKALQSAQAAILLVSPDFLASDFIAEKELPPLLDAAQQRGLTIYWIAVRASAFEEVGIDRYQCANDPARPLDKLSKPQRGEVLVDICRRIGALRENQAEPSGTLAQSQPTALKASTPRLPKTGGILIGRSKELKRLTAAWNSPEAHLISIVAWGGAGKTSLVKYWLGQMAADGYRGAQRVFDWSFYSQGTRDQAASADQFIDQALRFFGDSDPTQGGPYEKGERLADLVSRHKTLLVLDGLEPLQYPPGAMEGQLKDPALDVLIQKLSLHNPGLCIVTTREKLPNIAHLEETTAPVIQLEDLSPQAGALLLDRLGVKGTEEELKEASQAFAGHALALTLLGTYLSEFHHGDIRHWREVPLLKGVRKQSDHAVRVMDSYKVRLGVGGGKLKRKFKRVLLELGLKQPTSGEIAWSYLLLMGFFDRPAKGEEIQALLTEPPMEGLSEEILKLDPSARKRALSRLRRLRLLAESPPDDPDGMDAHPLLREYLTEQLQQHFPEACREGHRRLYEQLKQTAQELPDTLEEMMPLYQAVAHGCRAGLHREAYDTVYRRRIRRGNEAFTLLKLGAFGADLAAVACF